MNKRNTAARNLLGLIYFEMGETVAALGEWVISKHFQPEGNWADDYMDRIQSNPSKLDAMAQAIKKYNLALEAAKQNGDDVAILQLKKVVSLNPNFIRARQLLALLYIRKGEPERAKKQLERAARIDIANTTTLFYLQEIRQMQPVPEKSQQEEPGAEGEHFVRLKPEENFAEDKPNVMAWVTLVAGALLGILVTFFLIVPTARKNIRAEFDREQLDYSSELRIKEAALTSMEKEAKLWQGKYEEIARELASIEIPEYNEKMYDGLFDLLEGYLALQEEPEFEELFALAGKAQVMETAEFDNEQAKKAYERIRDEIYGLTAKQSYSKGREAFDDSDYEQAVLYLQGAHQFGYVTDSCCYYLGRALQARNDYEQAAVYYKEVLADFPDSSLAGYARTRLSEIGMGNE